MEAGEQVVLDLLTKGWDGLLSGPGRGFLEAALPAWLGRQRWFGAKTRSVANVEVAHWIAIAAPGSIMPSVDLPAASSLGDVILLLNLTYEDGSQERYQLPLGYASGAELTSLEASAPDSIVVRLTSPTGPAALHDAVVREEFRQALLALVEHSAEAPLEGVASGAEYIAATLLAAHDSRPAHEVSTREVEQIAAAIQATHSIQTEVVAPEFIGHMQGSTQAATGDEPKTARTKNALRGEPSNSFPVVRGLGALHARIGSAEQSNTNILYGQRVILKLFRRLQPGLNPDIEIGRFLTDVARFDRIPPFAGELTLNENGDRISLGMLQGLVANDGDGWQWTLTELATFFAAAAREDDPAKLPLHAAKYLEAAALLGRRTAELHVALATPTEDPAFAAESFTRQDFKLDAVRLEAQITTALDALQATKGSLPGEAATQAGLVLALRAELVSRARAVAAMVPSGQLIRIHGDYHLGQVLRTGNDFVLLDFEGEPTRSLAERRRKQSPLRDVAGMLRSFSYAAASALIASAPEFRSQLTPWARAWETAVSDHFLQAYWTTAAAHKTLLPEPATAQKMLQGYVLEKALYELHYELNNRPGWVNIPLAGILDFAAATNPVLR